MAQPQDKVFADEGKSLPEQIQARSLLDPRRWMMQALWDSMSAEQRVQATQQNQAMLSEMRAIAEANPGVLMQPAAATVHDVITGRPRILPAGVDPAKTCEHPIRVRQKKSKVKSARTRPCGEPVIGADPRYCAQHAAALHSTQPGL